MKFTLSLRQAGAAAASLVAIITLAVLAGEPAIDHLTVSNSDVERQQKQIDGLYDIARRQAWMKEFELCLKVRAREESAVELCEKQANASQAGAEADDSGS